MSDYPYLNAVGLTVVGTPAPHVRWGELHRRLGQWRYGFALRLGRSPLPRRGVPPGRAEDILAAMARENPGTWPRHWRPAEGAKP